VNCVPEDAVAKEIDCEELLRKIERKLCGIRMQTSMVQTNLIAALDLHYTISDGLLFTDFKDDECKELLRQLERRLKGIHLQVADDRVRTIDNAIASINARIAR
jgi:hypothetical protein